VTRRDATAYADMAKARAPFVAVGQDISKPTAGFFRHKLRSGSVAVGVRLYFGPPLDPITGEELDRSLRWMVDVNGAYFDDFDRVWPGCVGEPISEADYRRYCAQQEWARQHAPTSAYAQPTRKLDLLSQSTPLPF
jgi:hypothetical protein